MLYKIPTLSQLNTLLSQVLPGLGKIKRFVLAHLHSVQVKKKSYAQMNEDLIARKILNTKFGKKNIFYVDIGANHPTRISNTYLFYRDGSYGLTIEPNSELIRLHRNIRPRDTQLQVGCYSKNTIKRFFYSKTPVLSSFKKGVVKNLHKQAFLPVFTLDSICKLLSIKSVDFLSIDAEGLDLDVLIGSKNILKKTYLICIEANFIHERIKIINFLEKQKFSLKYESNGNLFFTNKNKFTSI